MLRSIRSTAFLAILLLAGTAVAKTKTAPAGKKADEAAKAAKPAASAPAATPETAPAAGPPAAASESAAKAGEAKAAEAKSAETKAAEEKPAEEKPAEAKAAEAKPAEQKPAEAPPAAAPAAAAPADDGWGEPAQAPEKKKRKMGGVGLDTQSVTTGGVTQASESGTAEKDWGFRFKGFFRAPMRLGIDASGNLTPNKLQFHAPPVIPDGNYTRWMFTNLHVGPWAEMLFQYGNQIVMMTTSIASYNITTGGWRELQDQLGIDRAFLTLKFPEALGNWGGMSYDVGIFQNRYGAMGKYDAGQYETYLVARTRIAGVTATADLDITDDLKLVIEGGGGAKVDQPYQRYQVTQRDAPGTEEPTYDYPSWQPYPGQKYQQGTNILVHGHLGLVYRGILTGTLHYVNSFVKDARWNSASTGGYYRNASPNYVPGEGSIQVFAADLKLDGGWMGEGYLGASYLQGHNVGVISDSIEVLHSQGGTQLMQNYFQSPYQMNRGEPGDGNGNILSVGFQYTFSLASFLMRPRPFWGQGPDITIRPYLMFNKVTDTQNGDANVNKLKGGLEGIWNFIPMMGAGLRGDVVQPNLDDNTQSFYIATLKLIFRSEFVTHEMIVLQGSYYLYGDGYSNRAIQDYDTPKENLNPSTTPLLMPWPFGQYGTWNTARYGANGTPPDKYVITLYASMWW